MAVSQPQSSGSARGLSYLILTILAVLGYALLVTGLSYIFGAFFQPTSPLLVGIFVVILALVFNPLRLAIQGLIDRTFFQSGAIYHQRIERFSRALDGELGWEEVVGRLRQELSELLDPTPLHIYIYGPQSESFDATAGTDGLSTSDVRFTGESELVRMLSTRRAALRLGDLDALPAVLQAERARLALLGVHLFVPLAGVDQLVGWLALGSSRSGVAYRSQELEYLGALASGGALAIERAQVVADLERRVRELNVLTRIAQGVSFTITFDDILELIYAQTNQVLPTRDFCVTLYEQTVGANYHVFYLENDERLADKENEFIPPGQGLELQVVSSRPRSGDGRLRTRVPGAGRPAQHARIACLDGCALECGHADDRRGERRQS